MSASNHTEPRKKSLSRDEREKWWEAFRAAVGHIRAKNGHTIARALPAVIRLASKAAWAEIEELRRAEKGERP